MWATEQEVTVNFNLAIIGLSWNDATRSSKRVQEWVCS